jgi:hypothetical protein
MTTIEVDFDVPMNVFTFHQQSMRVYGRWSGPARGRFVFPAPTRVRFIPDEPFFAGEWVTVSLSKDIRRWDGTRLATAYTWNFWIRTNAGSLDLVEVTRIPIRYPGEAQIQSYGAYAGDLDNDGWSDLAIPNELSNDVRVFLNRNGTYRNFTAWPLVGGSVPSTNEGADFNGDGHIDIAVGNGANNKLSVMTGNGRGGFKRIRNYTAGNLVRGLAICDLDGDGHDDIVTANRGGNNLSLFFNTAMGAFAPATNIEGGGNAETSCAVADANNDGIPDLFVGTFTSFEVILLLGDGNGGMTVSDRVSVGGRAWMLAVGDVNLDGHVDVVSANSFANTFSVIFGNGMGGLSSPDTYVAGLFPLAIDLGDVDGDGDLDLITSNFHSIDWRLWENDGTGQFGNLRGYLASAAGSCATLHDRDNDGDLDITGIDEVDDLLFLFENDPVASAIDAPVSPVGVQFLPNEPNPFNPTTTLRFALPVSGHVTITIYNIMGEEITTVLSEWRSAGPNRAMWNAAGLPSGVYVARLEAGAFTATRKLVLAK